MDASERLRRARLAAGVTQAELAGRLGITQPQIAAYERGRKRVSTAMASRILAELGVLPRTQLERHREAVRSVLIDRFGTHAQPRLFGSVGRGDDTATSDIDLVITAPPGTSFLDLDDAEAELERILSVDVDLITEGGLSDRRHQWLLADAVPL